MAEYTGFSEVVKVILRDYPKMLEPVQRYLDGNCELMSHFSKGDGINNDTEAVQEAIDKQSVFYAGRNIPG